MPFGLHTDVENDDTFVSNKTSFGTSKVTAPQDAHGGLVLQVYLGSNTLEFSAIRR